MSDRGTCAHVIINRHTPESTVIAEVAAVQSAVVYYLVGCFLVGSFFRLE